MTKKWTKIVFVISLYLFCVAFAGVGVAYLFDKSITQKTVKTVTKKVTEEVPAAATNSTATDTSTASSGNTTSSSSANTGSNTATSTNQTPTTTTLTAALVAQHNTSGNCWIILSGYVYNISSYSHSGGASHIGCGTDQTAAIHAKHGSQYDSYFSSFGVGALGSQI